MISWRPVTRSSVTTFWLLISHKLDTECVIIYFFTGVRFMLICTPLQIHWIPLIVFTVVPLSAGIFSRGFSSYRKSNKLEQDFYIKFCNRWGRISEDPRVFWCVNKIFLARHRIPRSPYFARSIPQMSRARKTATQLYFDSFDQIKYFSSI